MVLLYTSTATEPPTTIYVGVDKFENEDLLRLAPRTDVWVHIDKLSSPHAYIRIERPPGLVDPSPVPPLGKGSKAACPAEGKAWTYDTLPEELRKDAAQLVKHGSIAGNKKDNVTMLFTPVSNIVKDASMPTGAVTFASAQTVSRLHVPTRDTAVLNRLNKTKREMTVPEFQEWIESWNRERARERKRLANEQKNAELELARHRQAEARARDYSTLNKSSSDRAGSTAAVQQDPGDEDAEWERRQKVGDFDPDEDFM